MIMIYLLTILKNIRFFKKLFKNLYKRYIRTNFKYGVPKRKTTKSRAGKELHLKISSKNIIEDKKSGEYRLSHHLDLKTGYYKGRQVLDPKE